MKARCESNDGLPLNKIVNITVCIIIVRTVFEKDGKYYPQVCMNVCRNMKSKSFQIKFYCSPVV